ncbi:Minor extracellular protease vpr [Hypsizygus marmoreus]|uniref:Minor extracellular protease vpr n=1 Tax=Hypsizygus marmoreus TaxID=39966 RepID=A0A369JAE3_HYPMA|nr:Minor extracellular protease vpr [Hypsizygus marmoreus]
MKSFVWLIAPSLLSTGLVLSAVPLSSVKRESNLPTVANKFIVEVDTLSSIPDKRDLSPHEYLYEVLKKRDVSFEVNKEFNSQGLFVGAALTLTDAQDATSLLNAPGIKAIRPVRKFNRPVPVKQHVVTGRNDPAIPPDSQSTHILTGVDKLHAEGITGKGIKIGILDTGIDYTHPALGGGFGAGHKVIGGFDLVGDAYDGTNTPIPDSDPLDQCAGHGTHVAGIIGADPHNDFNISGVAYDASLSAYRVFGCEGFVTDDVIVDALLLGVKDGQDILTLSLGGADGWTESSSAVVASRIAATGKIVTIAAGNDGSSGSWYTSSPGNGIDVISVASLDNTVIPLQNATVGGVAHAPITYFLTFPLEFTETLPIFATSNDTTVVDDACAPLPPAIPDLSAYVVIVRRGTCTFVQKLSNIAAKGAKVALIYDNGNGFAPISVGTFPAALIQAADGEFLVSQFAAGVPVTLTFPQTGGSTNFPDPAGGLISSFTSYGPSNDFFFKPSVAAPGGNILSTLPTTQGSFGVESGTSMATPFVAGSAALLFSVKGKSPSVGRTARTLFETTAKRVPSTHTDGDPLQTVTQQGAGLINVFDAIHTTTIVSPGQLVLNDTAHFKSPQTFTIRNTSRSVKRYKLTHVPAGTAETVTPGTIFPALGPVPLTTAAASVTFSQTSVTVFPGQSITITARFSLPRGDASTFPVFSGFIQITSGSESLHVTYLGLGASLKNKQVVDNTDFFFGVPIPAILDSIGDIQEAPTNYTFTGGDFPTLLFRLVFGTPTFRVDVVDPNIKLVGTLNSRAERHGGPFFTFPRPHNGGSFAQVKVVGPLAEFNFVPRNNEDDNAFNTLALQEPTFANGTQIPNGSYRFLIRALRVTGDAKKEEDYESWLSPIIGVTP